MRTAAQVAAQQQASQANGRKQRERTACARGHKLTPENTFSRKDRPGSRECKKCRAAARETWRVTHPVKVKELAAARRARPEYRRKFNAYRRSRTSRAEATDRQLRIEARARWEQARAEATGELAQLIAEQAKDDGTRQWGNNFMVSLDKRNLYGNELYDYLIISSYQDELAERADRLAGY